MLSAQRHAATIIQRRVLRKQEGFPRLQAAFIFAWHACVGPATHMTRATHISLLRRLFLVDALSTECERMQQSMRAGGIKWWKPRPLNPVDAKRSIEVELKRNWVHYSRETPSVLSKEEFNRFWFQIALQNIQRERRGIAFRVAGWITRRLTQISRSSDVDETPDVALERAIKYREAEWRTDLEIIKICLPGAATPVVNVKLQHIACDLHVISTRSPHAPSVYRVRQTLACDHMHPSLQVQLLNSVRPSPLRCGRQPSGPRSVWRRLQLRTLRGRDWTSTRWRCRSGTPPGELLWGALSLRRTRHSPCWSIWRQRKQPNASLPSLWGGTAAELQLNPARSPNSSRSGASPSQKWSASRELPKRRGSVGNRYVPQVRLASTRLVYFPPLEPQPSSQVAASHRLPTAHQPPAVTSDHPPR